MNKKTILLVSILSTAILVSGCVSVEQAHVERQSQIPSDAVKMLPETDSHPPQLHSAEYKEPVPMPGPINSAGAEDSPFFPDGDDSLFFFFFTPDVRVPKDKQLLDGVTGIYSSKRVNLEWSKPERVWLQEPDKLSLDGCPFVQGNSIWFCSAREGFTGLNWFTAILEEGEWKNWNIVDFNPAFEVGELHFSADGKEVYFHSARAGGKGGLDIWVSSYVNGEWQEPLCLESINSEGDEGWPYLTPDGNELWFNGWHLGTPAVFRSKKVNGAWQEPELIISQFAGEPTLDTAGNIYFVHHFYKDRVMIEADIYVAYRK